MDQVYIEDFKDHVGETVSVRGWLYNRRSKGKIHFLQLRDGSGIVQAVMGRNDVPEEVFDGLGQVGRVGLLVER